MPIKARKLEIRLYSSAPGRSGDHPGHAAAHTPSDDIAAQDLRGGLQVRVINGERQQSLPLGDIGKLIQGVGDEQAEGGQQGKSEGELVRREGKEVR